MKITAILFLSFCLTGTAVKSQAWRVCKDVDLDNHTWIINPQNDDAMDYEFSFVENFDNGFAFFCRMHYGDTIGKWGILNSNGKQINKKFYDHIIGFNPEGWAITFIGELDSEQNPAKGKFGFIDSTGFEIPCEYDDVVNFNNGFGGIKIDGKLGVVDKKGKPFILTNDKKYDIVFGFNKNLAAVFKGKLQGKCLCPEKGLYGFIDFNGNEIVKPIYESVSNLREGLSIVSKNNLYGFIDENAKEIIPCIYKNVGSFNHGLAAVMKDNKWGYIDKSGKIIIPFQYDYAEDFSANYAFVFCGETDENDQPKKGLWGMINRSGLEIHKCKFEYSYIYPLENNYAFVSNKSVNNDNSVSVKYGIIDENGNEIVPCEFDYLEYLGNGLFLYQLENFEGIINSKKEYIIETELNNCRGVYVFKPNKDNFIKIFAGNIKGNMITSESREGSYTVYESCLSGRYCFVDTEGNIVIPDDYTYIVEKIKDSKIIVYSGEIDVCGEPVYDNKYGIFDLSTKEEIYECKYSNQEIYEIFKNL